MKKDVRTAVFDHASRVEACRFKGVAQPFPGHFHEYYVIGLIEGGERALSCKNQEYTVREGDVLLFNPGDTHASAQIGGGALDYRGLNIPGAVMLDLAEEVTGRRESPVFSRSVIADEEIACCFLSLHERIMSGSRGLGREEGLLVLTALLIRNCGRPFDVRVPECRREIERACAFMEAHCGEHMDLAQICRCAGLSKSALLRAFTGSKGVTPYRFLENIRIGQAKKLLEQGVPPAEAALRTGFSDQSHFTRYFTRFIGLSPGDYQKIFRSPEGKSREE